MVCEWLVGQRSPPSDVTGPAVNPTPADWPLESMFRSIVSRNGAGVYEHAFNTGELFSEEPDERVEPSVHVHACRTYTSGENDRVRVNFQINVDPSSSDLVRAGADPRSLY